MPSTSPDVAFFFDPACPWTWVTSRWLVEVADERDLEIEWRPFSLRINSGEDVPEEHRAAVEASHGALRVIVRLQEEVGNEAAGAFYAERGYQTFAEGVEAPDSAEVLSAAGLDPGLAEAENDRSLDSRIRSAMAEARAMTGDAAASPTLAVDGKGFFGPVLTAVPADAGDLWDHLTAIWHVPELHELKRERRTGPQSPARP